MRSRSTIDDDTHPLGERSMELSEKDRHIVIEWLRDLKGVKNCPVCDSLMSPDDPEQSKWRVVANATASSINPVSREVKPFGPAVAYVQVVCTECGNMLQFVRDVIFKT